MKSSVNTAPTLLTRPSIACPRCDGRRIDLAVNTQSSFVWRECEDCHHLWAIPAEWTPDPQPRRPPSGQ